jgi:TolB protein
VKTIVIVIKEREVDCPYCNNQHPDGARFCPKTGHSINENKTCSNCGQAVQSNWNVCVYCGQSLSEAPITPLKKKEINSKKTSRIPWIWAFAGIAFFLIVSGISVLVFITLSGDRPGGIIEELLKAPIAKIAKPPNEPSDESLKEEEGQIIEAGIVMAMKSVTPSATPSIWTNTPVITETQIPTQTQQPTYTQTQTVSKTHSSTQRRTPTLSPTPDEPQGKIVFTCQIFRDAKRDQICIINADGSNFRRLTTDDNSLHFYASLAPDGQAIIFSSDLSGRIEIHEMDLRGGMRQITRGLGRVYAPSISPDGSFTVFTNETGGHQEIWVMNRDGRNARKVFGPPNGDGWDPIWSPDGEKILFSSGSLNQVKLYSINKDGTGLSLVTDLAQMRGRSAWSPDGKTIATYAGSSWNREIYLLNNDGTNIRQLTNGGNNLAPSFSPDGNWIAFTSYMDNYRNDNGCEIYIMRIDGSDIRRLTENNYCNWQPRWGP